MIIAKQLLSCECESIETELQDAVAQRSFGFYASSNVSEF